MEEIYCVAQIEPRSWFNSCLVITYLGFRNLSMIDFAWLARVNHVLGSSALLTVNIGLDFLLARGLIAALCLFVTAMEESHG